VPRLLLLRHAKSSWNSPAQRDLDRPLNSRGREAAARMGQEIHTQGWTPDLVLCSPAARAVETLELVARTCPGLAGIEQVPALYDGSDADYVPIIKANGGKAETVLVIGHNPVIHATAIHLASGDDHPALPQLMSRYPTAALSVFDVSGKWTDLSESSATLTTCRLPRELGPPSDPE